MIRVKNIEGEIYKSQENLEKYLKSYDYKHYPAKKHLNKILTEYYFKGTDYKFLLFYDSEIFIKKGQTQISVKWADREYKSLIVISEFLNLELSEENIYSFIGKIKNKITTSKLIKKINTKIFKERSEKIKEEITSMLNIESYKEDSIYECEYNKNINKYQSSLKNYPLDIKKNIYPNLNIYEILQNKYMDIQFYESVKIVSNGIVFKEKDMDEIKNRYLKFFFRTTNDHQLRSRPEYYDLDMIKSFICLAILDEDGAVTEDSYNLMEIRFST